MDWILWKAITDCGFTDRSRRGYSGQISIQQELILWQAKRQPIVDSRPENA